MRRYRSTAIITWTYLAHKRDNGSAAASERGPVSESPVIGIMAGPAAEARPYADLVERSGGTPWPMQLDEVAQPDDVLAKAGGLLVAGGSEIGPGWAEAGPDVRGSLELALLTAALERDTPVLGVRYGMQALNVAFGGTPGGETAGHGPSVEDREDESAYHRIYIAPGTKLAAIVGSGGFVRVNSRHRLGVKERQKSPLLLASAYSLEDGIIEALESPAHDWVIGIQFQPERRMEVPPHFERLFQGLVERARGRSTAGAEAG